MTAAETLAKARAIAHGSSCFLICIGNSFKICRRVGKRVIAIGTRSDSGQALTLLRRVCNHPEES